MNIIEKEIDIKNYQCKLIIYLFHFTTKNHRYRYWAKCCPCCNFLRLVLCIFGTVIYGIAIAALLIGLLTKQQQTTTSTTTTTTQTTATTTTSTTTTTTATTTTTTSKEMFILDNKADCIFCLVSYRNDNNYNYK